MIWCNGTGQNGMEWLLCGCDPVWLVVRSGYVMRDGRDMF